MSSSYGQECRGPAGSPSLLVAIAGEDQPPGSRCSAKYTRVPKRSPRGEDEIGEVSERHETGCCWHRGNVHMHVGVFQGFCSSGVMMAK